MPIDTSMYTNFRPADLTEGLESGMRMRDMLDKRRAGEAQQAEAQGLKKAMQQSAVQNPDGTMSYDRGKLMSEMAKINPEKAMQMQEQLKAQDMSNLESNLKKTDYTARILGSINSPETFQRGISDAEALGLDVAPYKGMQYAEFQSIQPALMRRTLTAKEQLAQQLAEQAESRLGRQTNLDEKKFAAEPVRAERAFQNQLALKAAEAGYAGESQNRQFAHGEKIEGIRAGNAERLKAIADASKKGNSKAPPGYRFKDDGALEPIPGGPAAEALGKRSEKSKQNASLVVQDIGRSLSLIENNPSAAGTKDFGLMSYVPGSSAQSLDHLLDSVRSNIGFDKLQAMREASPTGGALGSVSEKETAMLQATAGKLSSYMPEDQLKDNLKRLYNQYNDIIHGPGKGPPRHKLSFDEQGQPVQQSIVNVPTGVQTEEIGGVVYKKVKGGWEEIPQPASR